MRRSERLERWSRALRATEHLGAAQVARKRATQYALAKVAIPLPSGYSCFCW